MEDTFDFNIISAEYSDYNHNQVRILLEDKDKNTITYFFVPDQEDNSPVYKHLQQLYKSGKLVPSINKDADFLIKSSNIRAKRDRLLSNSDKYMLEDYPISKEDRDKIKTYRQQLRDITNKKSFPDVVWPDFPNIGK
jgi:hypothetical protein